MNEIFPEIFTTHRDKVALRAVVLSLVDPRRRNGGTQRTDALVRCLSSHGHETHYVFWSEGLPGDLRFDGVQLWPIPGASFGEKNWPSFIRRLKLTIAPMPTRVGKANAQLAGKLRDLRPIDLLIIPTSLAESYIDDANPRFVWADFADVLSEFASLEAKYIGRIPSLGAKLQGKLLLRQERRVVERSAIVTAAGRTDSVTILERLGKDATWLPNAIAAPSHPPARGPRVAGLLADFTYWPNRDGLELLHSEWLPLLRTAGWDVVIAGRRDSGFVCPMGIDDLGPVDTVEDFYSQIGIGLVPIRRGGGMKVKLIECLLHGRPAVATDFSRAGFAGLPAVLSIHDLTALEPYDPVEGPSDDEREHLAHRFSLARMADDIGHLLSQIE